VRDVGGKRLKHEHSSALSLQLTAPSRARTLQSTAESGDLAAQGIRLEVVNLVEAKRGFVLLPKAEFLLYPA
jgi:hypothetical protein